jgi:hypothetical protein
MPAGDPIEMQALWSVVTAEQMNVQFIGALKTNIGHTEVAAGLCGLLRAMLMLDQGCCTGNLHFQQKNDVLDDTIVGTLCTQLGAVSNKSGSVGVSSFGYAGTNSHSILQRVGKLMTQTRGVAFVLYKRTCYAWSCEPENTDMASELLGVPVPSTDTDTQIWQRTWPGTTCAYVAQHRIGSVAVVSSTTFVQIALASNSPSSTAETVVSDFELMAVLFPDSVALNVRCSRSTGSGVSISSFGIGKWVTHSKMKTISATTNSANRCGLYHEAVSVESQTMVISGSEFYAAIGNNHHGDYRAVDAVWLLEVVASTHKSQNHASIVSKVVYEDSSPPKVCCLHRSHFAHIPGRAWRSPNSRVCKLLPGWMHAVRQLFCIMGRVLERHTFFTHSLRHVQSAEILRMLAGHV